MFDDVASLGPNSLGPNSLGLNSGSSDSVVAPASAAIVSLPGFREKA